MDTLLVIRTTPLACWRLKLAGIQSFAKTVDWRVQVAEGPQNAGSVRQLLALWKPVGCIVEADGGNCSLRPEDFPGCPVAFLDHDPAAVGGRAPLVRHDSSAIARMAVTTLLQLDLPHYAVVDWSAPRYWSQDKTDAFRSLLALHGRTCHVFEQDGANAITRQRRLRRWLRDLPKPCGVFGVNDFVTEQVMGAAQALGIPIPDDLAVIGADNDEQICENTYPSLTSVQPDLELSGRRAAELLHARIAHPVQTYPTVVVPPLRVVVRQSTRRLARTAPQVQSALERIRREACSGLRARDVLVDFPCSRRQAEIRFRAVVGRSVLEEIQDTRYQRALELLRSTTLPLAAVAAYSGWPSELVFRRFVHGRTGLVPTALRRQLSISSVPSSEA